MLDGSWLMAEGSWLMAKGGEGRLMAHGSWPRGAGPALGPGGAPGPAGSGPSRMIILIILSIRKIILVILTHL